MLERYNTDHINYAGASPETRDAQAAVVILYLARYARYLTGGNPDTVVLRAVTHHEDACCDYTSDAPEIIEDIAVAA